MLKKSRLQPVWLLMVTAMIAVTTFELTGLIAQEDPEKRGLKEESQVRNLGELLIASGGELDFLISDPLGKRTGIDPNTGAKISEIPDAAYELEPIGNGAAEDIDQAITEIKIFRAVSPIEGTYRIGIHSNSATQYDVKIYSHDRDGHPNRIRRERGSIEPGERVSIDFHYSSFPAVRGSFGINTFEIVDTTFDVNGSFTLGETSDGIDLLAESVTLRIGRFLETTSVNSFKADKRGFKFESVTLRGGKFMKKASVGSFTLNRGAFRFESEVGEVKLEITVTETGAKSFNFSAKGESLNLKGTTNPVPLSLAIGNDMVQASVTVDLNKPQ